MLQFLDSDNSNVSENVDKWYQGATLELIADELDEIKELGVLAVTNGMNTEI